MLNLNTIRESLKNNNKVWLGLGALILGTVAYIGYFKKINQHNSNKKITSKKDKVRKQQNHIQDSKITQTIEQEDNQYAFHKYYFDKNLQIRKILDNIQGNINVEQIYINSPLMIADEYRKFTKQIRNRRRLIRTLNQHEYIEIILQYQSEVDQLLQRSRQELIDQCQIDLEQFQRMKDAFQCSQNLQDLIRKSKTILKQLSLEIIRQIPPQKLKMIIQTEVNFIKTKLYHRLKQKLIIEYNLSQEQILKVIRTLIDDIVYQKFGYEREQIQKAIKKSMKEINQLEKERQYLQNQVGNISIQSDNESQNSKKRSNYKKSVGKTRSNVDSSMGQQFQLNQDDEN